MYVVFIYADYHSSMAMGYRCQNHSYTAKIHRQWGISQPPSFSHHQNNSPSESNWQVLLLYKGTLVPPHNSPETRLDSWLFHPEMMINLYPSHWLNLRALIMSACMCNYILLHNLLINYYIIDMSPPVRGFWLILTSARCIVRCIFIIHTHSYTRTMSWEKMCYAETQSYNQHLMHESHL